MPATRYTSPVYGTPRPPRAEPAAVATATGTTSATATLPVYPQVGDILICNLGSDNDFGAFNANQPGTSYPSGGGVPYWSRLGWWHGLGGSQLSFGMFMGRVETPGNRQVLMNWTNAGGGVVSLWHDLEGVVLDSDQVRDSSTIPTFGRTDASRRALVLAGVSYASGISSRPVYNGLGTLRTIGEAANGINVYGQYVARYRGGRVSIVASSGGRIELAAAVIY